MSTLNRKAIDLRRADQAYAMAEEQLENERKRNLICVGGLVLAGGAIAYRLVRRFIGMFN